MSADPTGRKDQLQAESDEMTDFDRRGTTGGDNRASGPASLRSEPAAARGTRAYQPPRILSREPLEVMAVSCTPPLGKAQGVCSVARS